MIDSSITAGTERRYATSAAQRERLAAAVAAHGPVVAAPPELVALRLDHLAATSSGGAATTGPWAATAAASRSRWAAEVA